MEYIYNIWVFIDPAVQRMCKGITHDHEDGEKKADM